VIFQISKITSTIIRRYLAKDIKRNELSKNFLNCAMRPSLFFASDFNFGRSGQIINTVKSKNTKKVSL